jgi:hypothetical protein
VLNDRPVAFELVSVKPLQFPHFVLLLDHGKVLADPISDFKARQELSFLLLESNESLVDLDVFLLQSVKSHPEMSIALLQFGH